MKAILRFALVANGFLKLNEKEEFQPGFLFCFSFGTALYIVSLDEAPCYAKTDTQGRASIEKCTRLHVFDMKSGQKQTRHIFEVHQNYRAVMATLAEAGRIFAAQDDFIASPRGMSWIGNREAKFRAAEAEGTLDAFYASTRMLNADGTPQKDAEFLPLTEMHRALRDSIFGELGEAAD